MQTYLVPMLCDEFIGRGENLSIGFAKLIAAADADLTVTPTDNRGNPRYHRLSYLEPCERTYVNFAGHCADLLSGRRALFVFRFRDKGQPARA